MVRKLLSAAHADRKDRDDKKNYEVQRIETFSDAVFGFAVTLLIVSLEVPKSYEELQTTMRGFFAFGISFTLLVFIWHEQHRFFRNYGMDDNWTMVLNIILLFIVLFYVYPLKFLFTLIFRNRIYGAHESPMAIRQEEIPQLMGIFAIGYIVIYSLFLFMYLHAYRKANTLGLNRLEKFNCKSSIYKQLIMIFIGIAALVFALTASPEYAGLTGMIYFLIGPALTLFYTRRHKMQKAIH